MSSLTPWLGQAVFTPARSLASQDCFTTLGFRQGRSSSTAPPPKKNKRRSCLALSPVNLVESRNRAHTYEAWTRSSCLAIETRGQYSCTTEQRCLLPSQSAACWPPPLPLPTPSPTPTQTAARPWPRPTRARSPPAPEMPTPTLWLTPSPADLVPLMPKPSQTPRPRQATARPRS